MIDIRAIAEQRSMVTGHPVEEWQKIIESGAETSSVGQLTDGEFMDLAKYSESPEVYATAVMYFEQHAKLEPEGKSGYDLLVTFVDESSFPFNDWLTSLQWMNKWIQFHKYQAEFSRVLGYIKCCDMSLKSSVDGSLPHTVKEMLETEGFESNAK